MTRSAMKSPVTKLALLLFVAFLDNFTQYPLLGPYAKNIGAGTVMVGWIVAIYSVANMVGNVGAGLILDKVGRRIPLTVGLMWAALGVWAYGIVGTPWGLMGARAFHGLGGSILVPAIFTLAADLLPPESRSQGMGRIGAVIGMAAVIGPLYSGVVSELWGPKAVFATVSVVMMLAGLLALTLKETLGVGPTDTVEATKIPFTAAPFQLANAAGFILALNLGALTLMIPLHMQQLGYQGARTGSLFSMFAIVAVAVMLTAGRWQDRRAILYGFSSMVASFVMLSLGSTFAHFALAMSTYGLGFGLTFPMLNSQVASLYRPEERGRAFGVFYAFYSLGVVIAPPLLAWLSTHTSYQMLYGMLAITSAGSTVTLYYWRHVFGPLGGSNAPSAPVS